MIHVGALADIPVGEAIRVEADVPIAVFRVDDGADGAVYAIDDTCTHQRASLSDGWLDGCKVECPLHATCFDLRTGLPDGPPAKVPVRTHQVVVMDGMIYLKLAEHSGEPEVEVA
ncbi:MAG TPA: bifunctional 3-phenylpropionate/cinnamic acid dioxygenase ferredoxin subunit [Pseudonocardia sp.]|jgi:3-phenylpropionate/trans-cinnamate dioxygenase ferredoxin subunit|uniref:bifunctional 3-phenylpropionate/cinnamic acid dioxygenase ferredoxin subunit n=1 Tax=Pseudonocardia sp. TaxID=60912 RepID=UPI002BEB3AAC|nr:bifunctional 3-phenylpropionate/cinnamic acid dioxygenase ferredoxin subunit [Pseudonocardia sp.]HTF51428.1 bifunctional 3-phenylpropionate/cinnamic acid dioxygenase ferredoxin subunit [Pseudonocardia sp.]